MVAFIADDGRGARAADRHLRPHGRRQPPPDLPHRRTRRRRDEPRPPWRSTRSWLERWSLAAPSPASTASASRRRRGCARQLGDDSFELMRQIKQHAGSGGPPQPRQDLRLIVASTLQALDYSVIQQCMHCGMCLPTCPTYDETKHERNIMDDFPAVRSRMDVPGRSAPHRPPVATDEYRKAVTRNGRADQRSSSALTGGRSPPSHGPRTRARSMSCSAAAPT